MSLFEDLTRTLYVDKYKYKTDKDGVIVSIESKQDDLKQVVTDVSHRFLEDEKIS